MKKKFGELSKSEQEAIELEYHSMNPEDFDSLMAWQSRTRRVLSACQ